MRVIVCGSRDWTDTKVILERLKQLPADTMVMTGGCRGADRIADELIRWSDHLWYLRTDVHFAEWEEHGKSAGPIRNQKMLDRGPDLVIAFHPDIESSKGTKHMVSIARAAGVPVEIITG